MAHQDKIENFKLTVQGLFPGLEFNCLKHGNNTEHGIQYNHFDFVIYPNNYKLSTSPYYYKKKSVVHFTSFHALNSILHDKVVRLYNLHNLNDPREFTFAGKKLHLNDEIIEDAKNNLFLMSFCDREILKKSTDEFNIWRLYGHQGKGVGIVFSLVNNPIDWRDFHISKVIYGSDKRVNFEKLFVLLNEINKSKPTVSIDLGKIYAFHKSKLFSPEMEVRLIFDQRVIRSGRQNRVIYMNGKSIFPIIKNDIFKLIESKDKIQFLQIPIYSKESSYEKEKEIPLLKIEQIIIGYDYGLEIKKIIKYIEQVCFDSIGYKPIIKQTRLRKYYWDIKNN